MTLFSIPTHGLVAIPAMRSQMTALPCANTAAQQSRKPSAPPMEQTDGALSPLPSTGKIPSSTAATAATASNPLMRIDRAAIDELYVPFTSLA